MIESEEKRTRILDIVSRWTEHTKANQMLRDGDISSLVSQILDEFYKIRLSCGHQVSDFNESIPLKYQSVDREGDDVEIFGSYCRDCAAMLKLECEAKEVSL